MIVSLPNPSRADRQESQSYLRNRGYHFATTDNGEYFCSACVEGKYNDNTNQSACVQCPANTYNPLTTSTNITSCLDCDVNAASVPGSVQVENCLCNLGYAGLPGSVCLACEPGTYRENTESHICENCLPNTYNVDYAADNHEECLQCEINVHTMFLTVNACRGLKNTRLQVCLHANYARLLFTVPVKEVASHAKTIIFLFKVLQLLARNVQFIVKV